MTAIKQTQITDPVQHQQSSIRMVKQTVPPFHVYIFVIPCRTSTADIDDRQASLFDEVLSALTDNRRCIQRAKSKGVRIDPSWHYMPKGIGRYLWDSDELYEHGYLFDPAKYTAAHLRADWARIVIGLKRDLAFQKQESKS